MSYDICDPELSKKIVPKSVNTALGKLEYVETGTGPPVVCIHGAMGGYDQSLLLAQTIGNAGYRYVCLSRPGYLGTPLGTGRSSEQQGDLVAALLDALQIDRSGVMVVSGGGPCAIQFGLRHAARCKGLVLVSTCATMVSTRIPWSFKMMMFLARWPWFVARIREKAARNLQQAAGRSIRDADILARTMGDKDVWPLFSTMLLSTFDQMNRRLAGTKNDIRISRTESYPLEQLEAPALIVHGTQDALVPFEVHARLFASRMPHAELLAVEGGEHVAVFTHRELVRARVTEFAKAHFST